MATIVQQTNGEKTIFSADEYTLVQQQLASLTNQNSNTSAQLADIAINVVTQYGADNTGINDSSKAIQNAINFVANQKFGSAQGGRVYLPPGIYLLSEFDNVTEYYLLTPKSNVHIYGSGDSTILKASNGLNTSSNGFCVFTNDVDEVTNFSVRELLIDCNASGNPISTTMASSNISYKNWAVGIGKGSDIWIENVTIKNCGGANAILFGNNTAPQSVTNAYVRNNRIINLGSSNSASNVSDFTAIYYEANNGEVCGNMIYNESGNTPKTNCTVTAIEMHSLNSTCHHNYIDGGVNNGIMVVATTVNNAQNNSVDHNIINAGTGVTMWVMGSSQTLTDLSIIGNVIKSNSPSGIGVGMFSNEVLAQIYRVTIEGNILENTFGATNLHGYGIYCYYGDTFNVTGNIIKGWSHTGIYAIQDTVRWTIKGNQIIDCGFCSDQTGAPTYGIITSGKSSTQVKNFLIEGNKVELVNNTDTSQKGILIQGNEMSLTLVNNELRGIFHEIALGVNSTDAAQMSDIFIKHISQGQTPGDTYQSGVKQGGEWINSQKGSKYTFNNTRWRYENHSSNTTQDYLIVGDKIYNTNPVAGGHEGWINVREGYCAPLWKASSTISVGTQVLPNADNGWYYQCTTAGTTGTTEPTWPTSGVGATVTDGTVVWTSQNGQAALPKTFGTISA